MLRLGPVKLYADDVIEPHTALMLEDYANRPGVRGRPSYPGRALLDVITELDRMGFQTHTRHRRCRHPGSTRRLRPVDPVRATRTRPGAACLYGARGAGLASRARPRSHATDMQADLVLWFDDDLDSHEHAPSELLDQRADVTIVNGTVAFSTGAVVTAAGHQLGQDPVNAGTAQKNVHCH